MNLGRGIIFYTILLVGALVILASLLSLVHDLPYWFLQILDFPRLQYLILAIVCLLLFALANKKWNVASVLFTLGLLSSIIIHSTRILPYLVGKKTVPDASQSIPLEKNTFSILITNVLITNRNAAGLLQLVKEKKPDMLLAMEVDQWWVNQLLPLKKTYPFIVEYPHKNAYGMALYSKLPLKNRKIQFLKHEHVPSFHATVVLSSNQCFRFHGVHPVAPVPSEEYPDNVGEKEVALKKVSRMVLAEKLPSLVAGDFNDVSWSNTSKLFEKEGKLNNVRIGRGLYNSYDARSIIKRWPLDHFFVTKEFALVELERQPDINSDHFPLYAKFVLEKP
jgi:endonuclease/exonuclease/phosphatase (EEP) superfamily protein YafD